MSQNFETYKKNLKRQLVEDEEDVFQNLDEILKQNSDAFDNLIILHSTYKKLKRKEIKNILSPSELTIEYSKVRDGMLQLITSLVVEDLIFTRGVILDKENIVSESQDGKSKDLRVENFIEETDWDRLLKIGKWLLDLKERIISGSGVFQYLLSNQNFGLKPYTVISTLKFIGYEKYSKGGLDKANSGIVLGWIEQNEKRRYYHVLFTGERILLEGIGIYGGDEYLDFVHFDAGVEFKLNIEQDYEITMNIGAKWIDVFIDNEKIYTVRKPEDMIGRVGIRPWRGKVECKYFEVRER